MDAYLAICKMWREYRIDTVPLLDQYLDSFRILFAYHSGKIENDEITFHDTREIFENGSVLNFTGSPRSIFEQQNQKLCYEYLKGKIIEKAPINIELIKEIHKILTSGTYDEHRYIERGERPGEFKKHDYITGINEVGSPPDQVEIDLQDLLTEINDYNGEDILKSAAYFHVRFENIHPFADGNGRVGRTLLNYYLIIRSEPPLIIFEDDKIRYFQALEKYDTDEIILPMCDFLVFETERTWGNTLERFLGNARVTKSKLKDMEG